MHKTSGYALITSTPEEMQAAVDAGDEESVRELFGMTPEEFADVHARLTAAVAKADNVGEMPEELECEPTYFPACVIWVGMRAARFPSILGIGIFITGAVNCARVFCK
jgi:hypothetical protein